MNAVASHGAPKPIVALAIGDRQVLERGAADANVTLDIDVRGFVNHR